MESLQTGPAAVCASLAVLPCRQLRSACSIATSLCYTLLTPSFPTMMYAIHLLLCRRF